MVSLTPDPLLFLHHFLGLYSSLLAEDSTSKSTYGERIKTIEARWTREVAVAQAAVKSRRDRRKDPRSVVDMVVHNGTKPNLHFLLQRCLSDRVTVQHTAMGINEDFFIEVHRFTVAEGWTLVTRELLLQGANGSLRVRAVREQEAEDEAIVEIDLTPFLNAGVPGVLLVWFMFRLERILNRFDNTVQLVARAIIRLLERTDPDEASVMSKALHRANGWDV